MRYKPIQKTLAILFVLSLALPPLICADMFAPGGEVALGEGDFSPIGGFSSTDEVSLESGSRPPSRLALEDYYAAYQQAKQLLDAGVYFRSRELQRLDPAMCVSEPDNPDVCSFNITGIENNYLDFNGGRLYWRFCADYDEPYVGVSNVPHDTDDPGDERKIDPYGYCPTWDSLPSDAQTRRVASGELDGSADIRNQMIDARRIFSYLAMAGSSEMAFDGDWFVDDWTVNPDGTVTRGGDGQPDYVRDVGIGGLLEATREIANVHMIMGNEFMVDALRFPFSTDGADTEQIVRDEQRKLERAVRQYELAVEVLIYTLNYNLRGATDAYIVDYFTPREFQLFGSASERMVTALTEIAKRDRLLGADPGAGDKAALARLNDGFLDQYLQGLALASRATALVENDPSTSDIDESKLNFLDNGGRDLMNNLRRLMQQTENIRAGLNPLGYEETFVPLKSFEDLLELTCGGRTVCTTGTGLLASAKLAGDDLRDSQRTFDEKFDDLKAALTSLQNDYDTILTEICGPSTDGDGDDLKDFFPCGLDDTNGNGEYEPGETAGLMGQSYWDMVAAQDTLSLAWRRVANVAEEIHIEEERAGGVINVTLGTANQISAYKLAIGKANAYKETYNVATSGSATAYADASASVTAANKTTFKASANPIGCILGSCNVESESSVETAFKVEAGLRFELAVVRTANLAWDPTEERIAAYESLISLQEAERDAQIEGANSAAVIRQLLLDQTELLIEVEIAQKEFNKVVDAHNLLVEQYLLYLTQREGTVDALQESYLSKPYFRLFRDGAALEAARTLDQATQAAYLTAKSLEYLTLSPVSYMHELYRVRNPANLRAFLDKLASDYAPIEGNYSSQYYRLSLAQDILGLTDENLNPDGTLTPAQAEQLRAEQFRAFLQQNHYVVPDLGQDKVAFAFGTTLDHPKFVHGVFADRISRVNSDDPGCGDGCRGLWLNLVTDQDPADFQGDRPQIKLTHGGHAIYRNGNMEMVHYNPGSAVMIGRSLPPGFEGEDRSTIMPVHLNLGLDQEPDAGGGLRSSIFYNLSVATSQWIVEIDLTNPTANTVLDISRIKDIEIRMDTTQVTPQGNQKLVEMEKLRVNALALGLPVPDEVDAFLKAYEKEQATAQGETQLAAHRTLSASRATQTTPVNEYTGSIFVNTPVNLGILDIGFNLSVASDGQITGALCDGCSPLYDKPVALTGSYDTTNNTFTFQTGTFTRTIVGRTAYRTLVFQGKVQDNGNILEGTYVETITGYTAYPIVSEGEFLVSRLSRPDVTVEPQIQLRVSALSIPLGGSVVVTASLVNGNRFGQIITETSRITFTSSRGVVSPMAVDTNSIGQAVTTFTGGNTPGLVTISATDGSVLGSVVVRVGPNTPPAVPGNPSPTDGTVEVPTNPTLRWEGGDSDGDMVDYTLAFGTTTPPPVLVTTNQRSYRPTLLLDTLLTNTVYYWAITATDGLTVAVGPVWSFTTANVITEDSNIYLPLVIRNDST